jgi:hypothetical protein
MLVYVEGRDIIPLILKLGCRYRCLVRSESQPGHFTPFIVPRYPLNMKLDGPQSQAGYYREEKNT